MTYFFLATTQIASLLHQTPSIEESRVEALFEAGRALMRRNKLSEAREMFQECLYQIQYGQHGIVMTAKHIDEMIIPALCNLAACALDSRDFIEAGTFCHEVLQVRPGHEGARFLLSVVKAKSVKS
eukprot:gene3515-3756_t